VRVELEVYLAFFFLLLRIFLYNLLPGCADVPLKHFYDPREDSIENWCCGSDRRSEMHYQLNSISISTLAPSHSSIHRFDSTASSSKTAL